ncbi:MAG: SHOCT domain-containing protein [Bacteroidota bacterium]
MYPFNNWMMGGWFMMVLFWILVIIGVVLLVRWIGLQNKASMTEKESALEILKKRYAKGEISKEEFEEKKKDLV